MTATNMGSDFGGFRWGPPLRLDLVHSGDWQV